MFRKLPSIPYMGSKREIACDIVNFIRINNPKAKVFIDMFGGAKVFELTRKSHRIGA